MDFEALEKKLLNIKTEDIPDDGMVVPALEPEVHDGTGILTFNGKRRVIFSLSPKLVESLLTLAGTRPRTRRIRKKVVKKQLYKAIENFMGIVVEREKKAKRA